MTTLSPPGIAPRSRSRGRARIVVATLAAVGFAALTWASFAPANMRPLPRLTYNPSDSVAVGWYRIDPHTVSRPRPLSVGRIVLVPLPATAAALAAQRGYLPAGVPLLKPVAAIAPQQVCISGGIVRIDGVPSAAVLRADRMGRPLPSWRQCRRLEPGELFLLSTTNPASFDSRYFGPVNASTVIGVAHPAWLETRR
ncbi:conjugation peptidase TraF [Paraburkholderia tropica]|uniref:Conjugation peptidase TraF n=1 Tax=Paraburkholderia tropica TaxID=92647 RepID=A0ABX5MDW7_9BURK|nr:S26 family signal peptidase [Paraburkholderia tropica]PXX07136.1 conjugation peptidase TraF [Paraburkholderia tropica]PZW72672.1 conjugation peptidase TraF [Paraburkholderia tropica]